MANPLFGIVKQVLSGITGLGKEVGVEIFAQSVAPGARNLMRGAKERYGARHIIDVIDIVDGIHDDKDRESVHRFMMKIVELYEKEGGREEALEIIGLLGKRWLYDETGGATSVHVKGEIIREGQGKGKETEKIFEGESKHATMERVLINLSKKDFKDVLRINAMIVDSLREQREHLKGDSQNWKFWKPGVAAAKQFQEEFSDAVRQEQEDLASSKETGPVNGTFLGNLVRRRLEHNRTQGGKK